MHKDEKGWSEEEVWLAGKVGRVPAMLVDRRG